MTLRRGRSQARVEGEERSYETQRRILKELSEAQREWESKTGSRLVVSSSAPYFRYTTEVLP